MFFQNLAFILPSFQQFLLKIMLIFSHKMVLIKNEAALLCVTMQERARGFVATIQLFPLKSLAFVVHFLIAFLHGKETFPKSSCQNEIVPLLIVFHLPYNKYKGVKICLHSCRTRVVRVAFVSHLCRQCSTRIALVSHSCRQCRTLVAFVSLVSGSRVVNQTRSFFYMLKIHAKNLKSARKSYLHPAFMSNCLTISHTCQPYLPRR